MNKTPRGSQGRYTHSNEMSRMGFEVNTFFDRGRNVRASFPRDDAEDFSRGARFIPGQVTLARREGQKVAFRQQCGPCCWFWEFMKMDEDDVVEAYGGMVWQRPPGQFHTEPGTRIYHFDPLHHQEIYTHHGLDARNPKEGVKCPECDNERIRGGKYDPKGIRIEAKDA